MKKALLVTALIGTLGVSTIVGYAASTFDGKTVQNMNSVANNFTENVTVTVDEARQTALQQVKGNVIGTDSSDKHVYEFHIQHGDRVSEISIDKVSGNVTEIEEQRERPVKAKISEAEAKRIATEKVSNGEIVKFQLEEDDGSALYDIEIVKHNYEYELQIDATTGAIIEYEQDDLDVF